MSWSMGLMILAALGAALAAFLVLIVVTATIAIMRENFPAGNYTWEDISLRVSGPGQVFFRQSDLELGQEGFRPVRTITAPEMPFYNEVRVYISPDNRTVSQAIIITVSGRNIKTSHNRSHIFHSYFEDGHLLASSNERGMPFDAPPWLTQFIAHKKAALPEILRTHREKLNSLMEQGHIPIEVSEDIVESMAKEFEQKILMFQKERGLLKPRPGGDSYHPSLKLALRSCKNWILSGGKRMSRTSEK